MDNRINEIRRKINTLRSEMAELEVAVRSQVNRGLDCSESALRLIRLRSDLARLIGQWKAAGGNDLLPLLQPRISGWARVGSRR